MSPLVSVVVPTHDRSDVLDRAVASARDQTNTDIEVLVLDDGPDPATKAYCANHRDQRVRYLGRDANLGAQGRLTSVVRNVDRYSDDRMTRSS